MKEYSIGEYNNLRVSHLVEFGAYLEDETGETILLPRRYCPKDLKEGKSIEVFVYTDSEDRPIATTQTPKAVVGDIVALEVIDVVNNIGAFLDWGLSKDLLLPYKRQRDELQKGDKCVVKVIFDKVSNRLVATTKFVSRYNPKSDLLKEGDKVEIIFCEVEENGVKVLVNGQYSGIVYKNEIYNDIELGKSKSAYLKKIREDGKLDISLKPFGVKAILSDKDLILDVLKKQADGSINCNSKSDPEKIKESFQMSKKAFKKALGGLYKERLIVITDEGISLKK